MKLTLPKWYDLHTHFRQGPSVGAYLDDHLKMGCAGALAMPNTKPPISRVAGENEETSWSIEAYREMLLASGADRFDQLIIPLYLTKETTAEMIESGAESGLLVAAKYYPPHGTTNSEHGVPMEKWIGGEVLSAMERCGVTLCIHGETHGLAGSAYFDQDQTAESTFYTHSLPAILETHPDLKIVCEHITTKAAVDFVSSAPATVGATITPQHLLYTVGDLIQGLRYHLYCLPVVKFEEDRAALRRAVTLPGQTKFFAGTDSAPHSTKVTDCGCAAGCYTGGCAPQLYAMAFEEAGLDLGASTDALIRFLSTNGPRFYGFPASDETFTLEKKASRSTATDTSEGPITPLPMGLDLEMTWSLAEG